MSKLASLPGTLISAALVGGGVFVGYEAYQCYKKKGSLSAASLIECLIGDISGSIQKEGDKFQCAAGLGGAPEFPFSPLAWAPKVFGAIGDAFKGQNFAKAVQNRALKINCPK